MLAPLPAASNQVETLSVEGLGPPNPKPYRAETCGVRVVGCPKGFPGFMGMIKGLRGSLRRIQ